MKTFILPWSPDSAWFSDEGFFRAMRNLEWGDIDLTFTRKPKARSGDNFYLFRTGTDRNGIVAKGFFLTDPYSKRNGDLYYTMDIRPTFMVSWNHPLVVPQIETIRQAVPELPDLKGGPCLEISEEGAVKLNAIWDFFTAQFNEEDFGDNLAEKSERPVAGIDEAVALASELRFDDMDRYFKPAILDCLSIGLAGETDDEKICGFLHKALEGLEWQPGELRAKGFSEHVVDTLCLLYDDYRSTFKEYIFRIGESGNDTAIDVKINSLRQDISCCGEDSLDDRTRVHNETAAIEYLQAVSGSEEN